MSSVTREQIIGLLRKFQQRMAAKRGMCDEHDRVLWDSAESIIAALQAAEPVGWVWDFLGQTNFTAGAHHKEVLEDYGGTLKPVFLLPCPPAKAQAQGEPYGYVYDGQLLCDEQDFADYFDGAQYDISTMTPVYTAPPYPAAVPEGWKLVPVEPTLGMLAALAWAGDEDLALGHAEINREIISNYGAMLTASPQPEEPAPHPVEAKADE